MTTYTINEATMLGMRTGRKGPRCATYAEAVAWTKANLPAKGCYWNISKRVK